MTLPNSKTRRISTIKRQPGETGLVLGLTPVSSFAKLFLLHLVFLIVAGMAFGFPVFGQTASILGQPEGSKLTDAVAALVISLCSLAVIEIRDYTYRRRLRREERERAKDPSPLDQERGLSKPPDQPPYDPNSNGKVN